MRGTKRAAEAALRRTAAEVDEGTHAGTEGTVAHLLDRWMAQYRPDWSPTTLARYESLARVHIIPALGDVPLSKLRPTHLNDLYAALVAKGLEQATIRKVHNVLRRALAVAVEWGWINANVALRAKRPKPRKHPDSAPVRCPGRSCDQNGVQGPATEQGPRRVPHAGGGHRRRRGGCAGCVDEALESLREGLELYFEDGPFPRASSLRSSPPSNSLREPGAAGGEY
jgi:hypothetical protein